MNKIGFNVLAWSAVVSDDLKPIIERLKTIGYDGVEFFVGSPEEKAYKQIGEFTTKTGLELLLFLFLGPDKTRIDPRSQNQGQKALEKSSGPLTAPMNLGPK